MPVIQLIKSGINVIVWSITTWLAIHRDEFLLALSFAVLGFIYSSPNFILWLNSLNPFYGVVFYYFNLFFVLAILERIGVVRAIGSFSGRSWKTIIGGILVFFAFAIVINWESCYVNTIIYGNCGNMSQIYFQSEDGTVYYVWSHLTSSLFWLRLFTFSITPFIIALIGSSISRGKPILGVI